MNRIFLCVLLFFLTSQSFAGIHTVSFSGFVFSPDAITINSGDTVNFALSIIHNAREVTQATWNANDGTSNGGFETPFGGGLVVLTQPGTYYYVCGNHYPMGMKGTITVLPITFDVAPSTISFSNVNVSTSKTDSVVGTNGLPSTLTIDSVRTFGGDFSVEPNGADTLSASGGVKTYYITFSPVLVGAQSGGVVWYGNSGSVIDTVIVDGIGVVPGISIVPTSINFGSIPIDSAATETIKVANTGTGNLNVASATSDNPKFTITPGSAGQVDPADTQKFVVTFSPATSGAANGNIVFAHNAPGSPDTVQVSGIGTFRVTAHVRIRWNLLSVPLIVSDYTKSALFPSATSNAYAYQGSYVTKTTLENGGGYWLKFSADENIHMTGFAITEDSLEVSAGWNLIGSVSAPILAASITSNPPGMITSNFFGYANGYFRSDTIKPGEGYFVKVNQAGTLVLQTSGPLNIASRAIQIESILEAPPDPPGAKNATDINIPTSFGLEQNFPNPFNPTTTLAYQLPAASKVTLTISNVLGQIVAVLANEIQDVGYRSAEWNAGNIASGVYFYRLDTVGISDPDKMFTQVRKMVLMR